MSDATRIQGNYVIPTVIEETPRGEREWTIFSRLLKDRIIFIGSPIDDFLANTVVAQLLFLDSDGPGKEISLYINSPGGSVTGGLAIYDTMQYSSCPITTICVGQAFSVAAMLLASGTPGRRFSLPHARILLHQPLGGYTGQASDAEIRAREIVRVKDELNGIMAKHCGKQVAQVAADTDREFYLSPEEAVAYGLIDQVIKAR
jgi:ATP-dependent Clp protease protease subunit